MSEDVPRMVKIAISPNKDRIGGAVIFRGGGKIPFSGRSEICTIFKLTAPDPKYIGRICAIKSSYGIGGLC
jgi:hypothetical protein